MTTPMHQRVRVKVCGITNEEDARLAIGLGADALGFNFFPGSKRFLSLEQNARWMVALPPLVTRVAVLVNLPLTEAIQIADHPAIDLVQFHGDEDAGYCAQFAQTGKPFIKALRLENVGAIALANSFSTNHVLIDAHVPGAFGGTGSVVDFTLARQLVASWPGLSVILAGGLTPTNVAAAVACVRPFAVDVASGVEANARQKSAALLESFIFAAGTAR